ncbi:hypothetical protein, partial [Mesorhizobium sp. M7A.F.Ca.US.006.04.2.1]|uniref:hypothetical protein n=1 Tax=Mesorhizobium sp. M7A.F.Ca.US.006.04.2.1 TaxID=2496696 RepID=UPI0019D4BF84
INSIPFRNFLNPPRQAMLSLPHVFLLAKEDMGRQKPKPYRGWSDSRAAPSGLVSCNVVFSNGGHFWATCINQPVHRLETLLSCFTRKLLEWRSTDQRSTAISDAHQSGNQQCRRLARWYLDQLRGA